MAVLVPNINLTKPIVFINSAIINIDNNTSSSLDYFVKILALISHKVHKIIGTDLIVKIPISNKSSEQSIFIDEIYNSKEKYSLLIVSAINEKEIHLALKKHIKSIDDYTSLPVFTIDKVLSELVNEIRIPYVTSNWEQGGEFIAKCVAKYINEKLDSKEFIEIAILEGLEGSALRIKGFKNEIEKDQTLMNRIRYTPLKHDKLNFTREGAYDFLKAYFNNHKTTVFDIIFACNDEMALGARDAILENNKHKDTRITGFDGTKEFTSLISDSKDNNLLATIDVKIENQIDALIELIIKVMDTIKNARFEAQTIAHEIKISCNPFPLI